MVKNMLVYEDGPTTEFGGFVLEMQEQVWLSCANCGEPMMVEFRYPQGSKPKVFEHGGWCYECQKETEMRGDTARDEVTQGQVTHEVNRLEKSVAFLLECSKTLHDRLEPILSKPPESVGKAAERVELCPMADRISDQNDRLENLGSAFTDLLHNLEI